MLLRFACSQEEYPRNVRFLFNITPWRPGSLSLKMALEKGIYSFFSLLSPNGWQSHLIQVISTSLCFKLLNYVNFKRIPWGHIDPPHCPAILYKLPVVLAYWGDFLAHWHLAITKGENHDLMQFFRCWAILQRCERLNRLIQFSQSQPVAYNAIKSRKRLRQF